MVTIKSHHAEWPSVLDRIAEDDGAMPPHFCCLQDPCQILPIEHIITQNQANIVLPNKLISQDEGVRKASGRILQYIRERYAQVISRSQQPTIRRRIFRRGYQENVPDPSQHHDGQRVIDHVMGLA